MKIFTLVLIAVLAIGTASTTFAFADSDSVKWNEEKLQWLETSYSSAGTGVVRAVDHDMNLDPKEVDNFYIYVWSESDAEGISLGMSETGVATGIFEGTVFFSTDNESSGHRLRVYEGDAIYAAYEDTTLPRSHATTIEEGILAMSMIRQEIPSSLVSQSDKAVSSDTGTIEWLHDYDNESVDYSVGSYGIIKLTDKALNIDSKSIDITAAHAWSETDPQGITIDLVETGIDTDIFYAKILFTGTGYSSHGSLSVSHGDTVTVSYGGGGDDGMSQDTVKITSFPSAAKKEHMTPLQQTKQGIPIILSPLKQHEMGVRYNDIQCRDGLELMGKIPYAHPKCVKFESVEKLVMRGWATTNKIIELVNPIEHVVTKNSTDYEVLYSLKGATLDNIAHDVDANSVRVTFSEAVGGYMVISIPRDLMDAKTGNNDADAYFLLIDGMEHMYGEKITDDSRIITVWFSKDARDIEIIGTFWI